MPESRQLADRLLEEIMTIPAVDVHSHVPAADPFARSLRDLLGYHYYTELAHSSGLAREAIAPGRPDEEMIPALLTAMENITNTAQYSWMVELAQTLFDFEEPRLTAANYEPLARAVRERAERPGRAREIMDASRIEKVFLTNNFDEDLSQVDTSLFVPCLRADTLVFGMTDPAVRQSLEAVAGTSLTGAESLKRGLGTVVEKFRAAGAKSLAISLPPHFVAPVPGEGEFEDAVRDALKGDELGVDRRQALQSGVLFALAELCADCELPFQLMYGALRDAYAHGVHQGRDLPHAGDSIHGLLPLLNAFPQVSFCLSVLSNSQIHELNSYGWILQNVVLSGHWWYLNVPEYIAFDLAARLQSVPKNKLIGYYSDMYKLEFGLAKFNMYRRVLAHVLAGHFVAAGLGSEEEAVDIARLLLRDNAIRIFRM